jgi:hypothetical protein
MSSSASLLLMCCRRYTLPGLQQEAYNSHEVGSLLADAVIKQLLPEEDAEKASAGSATTGQGVPDMASQGSQQPQQQQQEAERLPALQQGRLVGCQMPDGNTVFVCCSCPAAAAALVPEPPAGGCSLFSSSRGAPGVVRITLDAGSTIHQIVYMGHKHSASAAAAVDLMALVGRPFSYLACGLGLPDRLATELAAASQPDAAVEQLEPAALGTPVAGLKRGPGPGVWLADADVLALLQKPWAQLLLHEGCLQLRAQMMQLQGGLQEQQQQHVQQLVLDMLQSCRSELPGYRIDAPAPPAVC